jgi:methyl-accepting chemotaxis protein
MEEGYSQIRAVLRQASKALFFKAILSAVAIPSIVLVLFSLTIFNFTARQYLAFFLALMTVGLPIVLLMTGVFFYIQRRLLRDLGTWYEQTRNPDSDDDRRIALHLQSRLVAVPYVYGTEVGIGIFATLSLGLIAWSSFAGFPLTASLYYVGLGFLMALADFLITLFLSTREMRPVVEKFLTDCRGFGFYHGAGTRRRLIAFSLVFLLLTLGMTWVASSYLSIQMVMREMEKRGSDNIELMAAKIDPILKQGEGFELIPDLMRQYSMSDDEWLSIYDQSGAKVYEADSGGFGKLSSDKGLVLKVDQAVWSPSSSFQHIGSRDFLISAAPLEDNPGWSLVRVSLPSVSGAVVGRMLPAMILLFLITVMVAAFLTFLLSRDLTEPVQRLVKLSRTVGTGDLAVEVPVDSLDDIGELSSSYAEMIESLRNMSANIIDTSGEVNEGAESVVAVAEEIMAAIEELNALVQELSEQIENEVDQVRNVEEIMKSVSKTISSSHGSADESFEMSKEAEKLVLEGREHAHEAVEKIADFKMLLDDSMQAIFSLGESSLKISGIVDIMSSIADQTNMLALNAAIEAARVPEYGKGFAVVADEVKKLAQQAVSSAQRISDLVGLIQSDVERAKSLMEKGSLGMYVGIESVERTDKSLVAISDTVSQMAQLAGSIAEASAIELRQSEELAISLQEMRTQIDNDFAAYEQINASSDQQAKGTMELASTAEQLSHIAQRLHEMVEHFRIK